MHSALKYATIDRVMPDLDGTCLAAPTAVAV
jgi:hypothetical protein